MDMRTRKQEMKYGQALGYGWGAKDAAKYITAPEHANRRRRYLTADVLAFATYFSLAEDMTGHHYTLEKAWDYFTQLKLDEQKAYGSEWQRTPYSEYFPTGQTERQGTHG